MIIELGWYWSVTQKWCHGAKLRVENSTIQELVESDHSRFNDMATDLDYTQSLVLPGFINTHCHLELTEVGDQIPAGQSFSDWVGQLQRITKEWDEATWESSYDLGVRQNLESGTTRILDVGNRDWSSWLDRNTWADQVVCFQKELLGIRPTALTDITEMNAEFCSQLNQHRRIIPHAPFSVSPELFQWIQSKNQWLNIHLSESLDEKEFFESKKGPLFDFVKMIYPEFKMNFQGSPYQYLNEVFQAKFENPLITHANTLSSSELDDLTQRGGSVVHCPGSREYFQHPQNNWTDFIRRGGRLCLGTDSLASNTSLDMWHELELFQQSFPELTEAELIQTVTTHAADAILYPEEGRIKEGSPANLQFLKWESNQEKTPSLKDNHFRVKPHQVMYQGNFHESK